MGKLAVDKQDATDKQLDFALKILCSAIAIADDDPENLDVDALRKVAYLINCVREDLTLSN